MNKLKFSIDLIKTNKKWDAWYIASYQGFTISNIEQKKNLENKLETKKEFTVFKNTVKQSIADNSVSFCVMDQPLFMAAKKFKISIKSQWKCNGKTYVIKNRLINGWENIKKIIDYVANKRTTEKEKKQRAIQKAKKNKTKILEAIYTISKEAKRQRDIKYKIADSVYGKGRSRNDRLAHYQIANAKKNVQNYYRLKQKGIDYLLSNQEFDNLEIHDVNGYNMACLYRNGFCFHFDPICLEHFGLEAEQTEAKIDGFITANKIKNRMSLKTAVFILGSL